MFSNTYTPPTRRVFCFKKEGLRRTSHDRRRSENPFVQRDNFYKSFEGYLGLIPPGRPELLALTDMVQVYSAKADLDLVRIQKRKHGASRKLSNAETQAVEKLKEANVSRWFGEDTIKRQRYQNVIRFFHKSILPGLREAEEAIINNATNQQTTQDEVKAIALKRVAVQLSEYKEDFANNKEKLQENYGTILE